MADVLNGKTSFIISGEMSLNILYNSTARHCEFYEKLKQNCPALKDRQGLLIVIASTTLVETLK